MDPTPGKFENEKFDGKEDFGLWKLKMLAQLEIQGLLSVLEENGSFEDGDFVAYALSSSEDIEIEKPKSFQEATRSKDWKFWNSAAYEEMISLFNFIIFIFILSWILDRLS
ncbi:unnamed protein product, partial [Brassica rapa subsp. trilocularis]